MSLTKDKKLLFWPALRLLGGIEEFSLMKAQY